MIYRESVHQVLGAAEFLKTLQVPTSAPASAVNGQVWAPTGGHLSFFNGSSTKIVSDDTTAFGGDVTGTIGANTVVAIEGKGIAAPGAGENGYVITYNHLTSSFIYTDAAGNASSALSAAVASLNSSISTETTTRLAADATLTSNLGAEITNRTNADNTLQANITAEEAARAASDTLINTALAAEVTRASAAETLLSTNLGVEVGRAETQEGIIATNLQNEINRAVAIDATLTSGLASEVAARQSWDTAEEAARIAGDATLTSALGAASTSLAGSIASEVSRATAAEASLQSAITAAVQGLSWLHNVADAAALAAVSVTTGASGAPLTDGDVILTENDGLGYRWDSTSTASAAPGKVVVPSSNPASGRWLVTFTSNQNHELLTGLLGGAAGDHYHLTAVEVGYLPNATEKAALDAAASPSGSNAFATIADVTAASGGSSSALATEVAARIASDYTLQANITAEIGRATAAEATLTANLATESNDRAAADMTMNSRISDETTRAALAEATLQANITAEATARGVADTSLATSIAAEVSRATAAEATLTSDLSAEVAARIAGDATLQTHINTEVSRAIAAEATLTTNLAAEVTRAGSAEASLQSNIDTEVAARIVAVNAEASLRSTNDLTLQGNIDSEASTRSAADASLLALINAQIVPSYSHAFTVGDWVDGSGAYAGVKILTLPHGITLASPYLPQVTVYETTTGANKLVGGCDVEVGLTNVILAVDPSAAFQGSIHLLYR
jgi:hypothetical protein